jgi:hypothetical protein
MRRIIERVVTVVTTTTWKISWEADSSHLDQPLDSVSNDFPGPNVLSETIDDAQTRSPVIKTKEDDPSAREEKTTDLIAEDPPQKSYSYRSKNERKSKP